jgi:hypothetical protein
MSGSAAASSITTVYRSAVPIASRRADGSPEIRMPSRPSRAATISSGSSSTTCFARGSHHRSAGSSPMNW